MLWCSLKILVLVLKSLHAVAPNYLQELFMPYDMMNHPEASSRAKSSYLRFHSKGFL